MTNSLRILVILWISLSCFVSTSWSLVLPAAAQAGQPAQILWQRTLEDAQAQASAEQRPLLVVVNVDGESASDRIVQERYRDPKFVEWTRRFVCVVASISRHNPRDFDDVGRRTPCPRLGEVTCGEHIALEPILYDRFLGGERISPRHALIQPDGTKSFDLFLLFDLTELDLAVERFFTTTKPAAEPPTLPHQLQSKKTKERLAQWRTLAASRMARGRATFEALVHGVRSESWLFEALDAVAELGDAGSIEVLRLCLSRANVPSPPLIERIGATAQTLKVGRAIAGIVRARLAEPGRFPGSPVLGDERVLLPLLARFDATNPTTRSFLLAHAAIGEETDRRAAASALGPYLAPAEVMRVAAAIEDAGGACEFDQLMQFAVTVGRNLEPVVKPAEVAPSATELEQALEASDQMLAADPTSVEAWERFGRTSLALAREYITVGGGDPRLLLEDAREWLGRVAAARPKDASLGFARARAAYLTGRHEEQERIAAETFGGFPPRDALPPEVLTFVDARTLGDGDVRRAATMLFDENRLEALRWEGDAAARLLSSRTGHDPADETRGLVRGARALAFVAVAPSADETDWLSLASFLAAIGLEREALCAWETGAGRLPESNALRDGLNRALWRGGRLDLAPIKADWIAGQFPDSAASAWHAGYAWILRAEDARRELLPEEAIAAYGEAIGRLERSRKLRPDLDDSAAHYIALSHLGLGFAHFDLGQRSSALESLAQGLSSSATLLDARDGLDRDVPDLIDALLEWRAGRRSTLAAGALAEKLVLALPSSSRPSLMVADAALREGLRADGRSSDMVTDERSERVRLPSAEGDEYMQESIAVARLALRIEENDATRTQLAQSLTVQAERFLMRRDIENAAPLLDEAALIMEADRPMPGADQASLAATALVLREKLGPARPVFRPGR